MGDRTPDPIGLVVDTQNPDRYARTLGRAPAFGIAAQAVDTAVKRHKHTIGIHHTDRPHIAVANGVAAECFFIGVFRRLLHGCPNLDMVSILPVDVQDFYQDPLARLELTGGVHQTLVAQLPERNVALHTEQVDKDPGTDHYLEIPFDLSEVLFITTANTTDTIPRPLLDRMEIIELSSYTDEEKVMIAKDHLLPKQMAKHGLKKSQLRVTEDALREIIHCYTRESGVRNLERELAQICRKTDKKLLEQETPKKITVTGSNVEEFLGIRKFLPDRLPGTDQVGLVTGLAWTSVGGEVLEVEVNVMEGSGRLELTGNLGDVMKESVHAAMSYIRANAKILGVETDFYKTKDIHVHFPEGAVPKDGPSAGVTVCTAIVSALTGSTVRRDLAMTGEISIRGRVLPIGGLKEKTMAALRHGIRTVVIPKDNERDLEEIDQTVRKSLNFITAQTVDTVLDAALNRKREMLTPLLTDLPPEVKNKSRKPEIRQ